MGCNLVGHIGWAFSPAGGVNNVVADLHISFDEMWADTNNDGPSDNVRLPPLVGCITAHLASADDLAVVVEGIVLVVDELCSCCFHAIVNSLADVLVN